MVVAVRDNLPADVTILVGRRTESVQVKQMLSSSRLVTLAGVGGVGKTRLALHVSRQVRRAFIDGVWWIALAEVGEPELLGLTVMQTVGLRTSALDPTAALVDYLRDKELLLVLDNCEHLASECATLVTRLLSACPKVRVLTTSREVLDADGESTFMVPPLPVPDPDRSSAAVGGAGFESVTLFAMRASAVLSDFTVTSENLRAVASLCRQLDGLPLAIELAAVRMRALSVEQILARHDDSYELLTRRNPAASPRHQSLRAAVDWSYELCSPKERLLWARLSMFAGGASLAAAESVCSGDGLDREDVLEAAARLVDKSILMREDVGGRVRYRFLETIRQYGRERLRERGEESALRRRHRDYYAGLSNRIKAEWFGPDQATLFAAAQEEHANLRASLEFCLTEPGEAPAGLHMAGALWIYWCVCGLQREGLHWLERALACDTEPSRRRATALWSAGYLAVVGGEMPLALSLMGECRELSQQLDDPALLAHATCISGFAILKSDPAHGLALLNEAVRLERALGEANPHLLFAQTVLALGAAMGGQADLAVTLAQECRAVCEARGDRWLLSWNLVFLGIALWRQGRGREATDCLRQAIRFKEPFNDLMGIGCAVEHLAWAAVAGGDAERGVRLLGAEQTLWQAVGPTVGGFGVLLGWRDNEVVPLAKSVLGESAYRHAFATGAQFTRDQVVAYALGELRITARLAEAAAAEPSALTRREMQIAELLADGASNKEIADKLVIARRTAESHVGHILTKLGFTSRSQVAAWVADRGHGAGERALSRRGRSRTRMATGRAHHAPHGVPGLRIPRAVAAEAPGDASRDADSPTGPSRGQAASSATAVSRASSDVMAASSS